MRCHPKISRADLNCREWSADRLGKAGAGGYRSSGPGSSFDLTKLSHTITYERLAFTIREFVTVDGRVPFREWLGALDVAVRARIQVRVMRFETGNLGDHKSVGDGVWEARMTFGAGYRLYFGKDGNRIVVLLMGSDKSSQTKDIKNARQYWSEYLPEVDHGKKK